MCGMNISEKRINLLIRTNAIATEPYSTPPFQFTLNMCGRLVKFMVCAYIEMAKKKSCFLVHGIQNVQTELKRGIL